jgi:uncharacterized membrane protein
MTTLPRSSICPWRPPEVRHARADHLAVRRVRGLELLLREGMMRGFGRHPLCKPSAAAPRLGAFVAPFCWRCSGLFAGVLVADVAMRLGGVPSSHAALTSAALLIAIPPAADVAAQRWSRYRSNSKRRFVTGVMLGGAVTLFSHGLVAWLRVSL